MKSVGLPPPPKKTKKKRKKEKKTLFSLLRTFSLENRKG